jgi:hypothetical protein
LPRIREEQPYNGALERINRLGLTPLLDELRHILTGFTLRVHEEKDANGGAAVRRMIDARFREVEGWRGKTSGGIGWRKCFVIDGASVCVGVEIQFSARSDLVVIDIIHLRQALTAGEIDVGILVLPTDRLSVFLTDRGPSIATAERHVLAARAEDLPLLLIALEHDGPGPPLTKQGKRSSP